MIPLEYVDISRLVASHLSSPVSQAVNDHDYAHLLFLFLTECAFVL